MKLPSWLQPADGRPADAIARPRPIPKLATPLPEPAVDPGVASAKTPADNDQGGVPVKAAPATSAAADKMDRSRDRSLYQAILSSLYDAVVIVDQKGFIIASNGRAEQFFGYPADDFWNLPCSELITGFNSLVLAKIRDHVISGRFTVINANCLRKDGDTFPAEIAISSIHYLNEGDLLLTVRSLERRKKAEERRELELEAVRHTCIGLMVCNREGLIEYVNQACIRLLQFENEHQMNRRFLGDFCESLKAAEQMLRAPSATNNWFGRASFRSGRDRSLEFTVTSAMCPARKDMPDRVAISLMPVVKSL